MTATIPTDAIDPNAAYREWVDRFLWHVDQLTVLVETTGTIALAVRCVHAAPLTERLSGGGYIDNVPLVDGPESRNAPSGTRLAPTSSSHHHVLASRPPQLPPALPDVQLAREWAYAANAWLSDVVYDICAWPDLDELEEQLLRLIRRARPAAAVHRAAIASRALHQLRRARRPHRLDRRP